MPFESSDEIRNRVVALIARHTGMPVESIDLDTSIWDGFPPNEGRREHPAVTSFVRDLHDTYDVYLTEQELEGPTPSILAEHIAVKLQNPAASQADRDREHAERRRGARSAFLWLNLALVVPFALLSRSSWTTAAGVAVFINGSLALVWWLENRRLRSKR